MASHPETSQREVSSRLHGGICGATDGGIIARNNPNQQCMIQLKRIKKEDVDNNLNPAVVENMKPHKKIKKLAAAAVFTLLQ